MSHLDVGGGRVSVGFWLAAVCVFGCSSPVGQTAGGVDGDGGTSSTLSVESSTTTVSSGSVDAPTAPTAEFIDAGTSSQDQNGDGAPSRDFVDGGSNQSSDAEGSNPSGDSETASSGQLQTNTTQDPSNDTTSATSAPTSAEDTSAETPLFPELPARPEITIPAVPDFEFDESSCIAPRMGTQTVELQADIIDLQGIDCILGDLQIWPTSLLDVSGLESLRYVSGDVLVGVSQTLNSLVGLGSLETIGGDLTIQQTPVLVSATGLSGLKRVGGNVRILQNVTLQTLAGLDGLEAIGGTLELTDNQNLNLLGGGLEALEYVGGVFTVKNNRALLNLNNLDSFEHAADGIYVSNNAALSNVSLPALRYAGGDVVIANGATTTLLMSALEGVAGALKILPNDEGVAVSSLSSIDFGALRVVGGELLMGVGPDLLELAMPQLTFVDGALRVGGAEAVLTLELPQLARVGGEFRLQSVERLRSVELPSLLEVGGHVSLASNARLADVHFPQLVTAGGSVYASDLPLLATVEFPRLVTADGFSIWQCGNELGSLGTIDLTSLLEVEDEFSVAYSSGEPEFLAPKLAQVGALTFEGNDFVSIAGFPRLREVGADLVVQHHPQLTSVTGLERLTTVGGDVWVLENSELGDLSGLERLTDVAGTLTFEALPQLSELVLNVASVSELRVTDCGMFTVALPELVSGYIILFNDNPSLTCLHLPKLTTMEPASFGNPPMFAVNMSYSMPTCQLDAIRAQILDAEDLIYSSGFSDTAAVCSGERCW